MASGSTINALKKLTIRGCESVIDKNSSTEVYHVNTPHALAQAAGYLKYISGKNEVAIFFRGQARIYDSLAPTLFRGIKGQKAQSDRVTALRNACAEITKRNKIFDGVPFEAHEPLLQHYGLKTSWIDLVDNVWIALWFACHRAHAVGEFGKYLHFERRDFHADSNPYAYVILVEASNRPSDPYVPGLCRGADTELIDLRVSAPSVFLRPHAQHGVLFRLRGDTVRRPTDYKTKIRGIIRVELRQALSWLGSGDLTGTHSLFPPAFYDHGYALLLNDPFVGNEMVGSIQHIGT